MHRKKFLWRKFGVIFENIFQYTISFSILGKECIRNRYQYCHYFNSDWIIPLTCHNLQMLENTEVLPYPWMSLHSCHYQKSAVVQKQMLLPLIYHQKVNSSLTLPHDAYVSLLTSSHQVSILSSHVITGSRASMISYFEMKTTFT